MNNFSQNAPPDSNSEHAEKTFRVRWEIDQFGRTPEEAAKLAFDLLRDPASIATILQVEDEENRRVLIDVDADGCGQMALIKDERELSYEQHIEVLSREVEIMLARLLKIARDPVSIQVGKEIDIELWPYSANDSRVVVGALNRGYTLVNYTHEGLVVDLYQQDEFEPMLTQSIYNEDLFAVPIAT